MKIPPIYFKEFKSKSIDELNSFAERYEGYDLLILIRTKYVEEDDWFYSFEILHTSSCNDHPFDRENDYPFEWDSDWYEGQEFVEYCGGAVIDFYINLEGIQ